MINEKKKMKYYLTSIKKLGIIFVPLLSTRTYVRVPERKTMGIAITVAEIELISILLMSTGLGLPGKPISGIKIPGKPPLDLDLDDLLEVYLNGVPYGWFWLLWILFMLWGLIKNFYGTEIDIRYKRVIRAGINIHDRSRDGYCIYDLNDVNSSWLSYLFYGVNSHYEVLFINGVHRRCLLFDDSFSNAP